MRALRALVLGAVFGWLLSAACSSGPEPCQVSCTGCCDLANTCQPGNTATACGDSALQCSHCGSAGQCVNHACVVSDGGTPDAGGGNGGGTGGGDTSSGGGTGGGGGTAGGGGGGGSAGGTGGGNDSGFTIFEPDAGYVNVTFGNCSAFNPCGGNPIGVWVYTSDCIPDTDFQGIITKADSYCGAGSTSISNKFGTVRGWTGFDGVNARHVVSLSLAFTATITGAMCSNSFSCTAIATNLSSLGLGGTCGVSGSVCICNLNGGVPLVDDTSSYTQSGHTLTLTDANKTLQFCAGPTKLIVRETTASGNTPEPGYPNQTKQAPP